MQSYFSGKRALVTGAGRGIGKGIVIDLLKLGAHVVALDQSEENLGILKKEHPEIDTIVVDLNDWENTKKTVESVLPIDLLVNNAGVADTVPISLMTAEIYDKVFNVNIKAVFNVTQVVATDLMKRGVPGSIVNISSVASLKGGPMLSLYCATKAAIEGFTRAMAVELGGHNIRINTVRPYFIMTDLVKPIIPNESAEQKYAERTQLKKLPKIQDVVDSVIFLLSDKAKSITGTGITVDSGAVAFGEIDEVCNSIIYLFSDLSSMTTGANLLVDGGYVAI